MNEQEFKDFLYSDADNIPEMSDDFKEWKEKKREAKQRFTAMQNLPYEQIYGCPYMTEVGCEAHINALALMAHNILNEGENMEMCGEQCCIGCTKSCGYRCGQAHYRTRWEKRNE